MLHDPWKHDKKRNTKLIMLNTTYYAQHEHEQRVGNPNAGPEDILPKSYDVTSLWKMETSDDHHEHLTLKWKHFLQ